MVGDVVRRLSTTPPDVLVRKILHYPSPAPSDPERYPKACGHGIAHEKEALGKYIQRRSTEGVTVRVDDTALMIDEDRPWFGAKPDGIIRVKDSVLGDGVLEIKCPYVDKSTPDHVPQTIMELASVKKSFYLLSDGEINKKHNCFYQIQAEIGVAKLKWCDFVVYYKVDDRDICDMEIRRVMFDRDVFDMIVRKAKEFILQGVIPEILTERIKRGKKLYQNSEVYRYKTPVKKTADSAPTST